MNGLKRLLMVVLAMLFAFSIASCNDVQVEATGDNVGSFTSYEELKSYLQDNLNNQEKNYSSGWLGAEEDGAVNEAMDGAVTTTVGQVPTADDDREYSETNNQVDGVEEADKILTDGYKIYIVSGQKFFIVDADTLNIDYTLEIEDGYMNEMYLYGDRVVLLSYVYHYYEDICTYYDYYWDYGVETDSESADDEATTEYVEGDEDETTEDVTTVEPLTETYTYQCYRYSYGTQITVLDVEDTENVEIVREVYLDSSYMVESRMINENIYLVLNNYMYNYGWEEDNFIPEYRDSAVSDDLQQLPASSIYFMPDDGESYSYLLLVSFDVTASEEASIKAYLGSSYQLYMSQNNLYSVIYKWSYNEEIDRYEHFTYIVRFAIEEGELSFKALGEIEGSPLNQFSMDEYDGVFRIATSGWSWDDDNDWQIDNFIFCLDATTDDEMTQISVLGGLGKPGERIYSARFSGVTAYVVTFETIDPLYKIDLSDPVNPEIVGQLEEEGVSDYLHEISDTLMIGIGRQAETNDEWTWFTGVKVALYDISGNNPVNLDTFLVEGEYSYTNVAYDHKAFLEFTPTGADFTYVGIPVFEYYEDYWGYSQSLYLFKVYHSGSIELEARLTHMVEEEEGYYRYFDSIERAVIIEDHIYTVSYSGIRMFDMNDDFSLTNEAELNPTYYSYWGYPEVGTDELAD